jgi:hypothetical protein
MIHGEPEEAKESSVALENRAVYQVFEVIAGDYQQARIRVQVCQLQDGTLELDACGGLYADVPVVSGDANANHTAFGTDLMFREELLSDEESSSEDDEVDEYDFE